MILETDEQRLLGPSRLSQWRGEVICRDVGTRHRVFPIQYAYTVYKRVPLKSLFLDPSDEFLCGRGGGSVNNGTRQIFTHLSMGWWLFSFSFCSFFFSFQSLERLWFQTVHHPSIWLKSTGHFGIGNSDHIFHKERPHTLHNMEYNYKRRVSCEPFKSQKPIIWG